MRIVILGAGRHSKVVADAIDRTGRDEVVGFVDGHRAAGSQWFGRPVLGSIDDLDAILARHGIDAGVAAIGDNVDRAALVAAAEQRRPGLEWVTVVHPDAVVAASAVLGAGTVVMAGAVVNPDAVVGTHCVVNTNASLDHDGRMGSYSSLGPGVVTGGCCTIGEYSAIAIGVTVAHDRTIGRHSVVGAGAVVVRDIPDGVLAFGVPARVVRARAEGEPYL